MQQYDHLVDLESRLVQKSEKAAQLEHVLRGFKGMMVGALRVYLLASLCLRHCLFLACNASV